jgi:cytochrome b6-f complex iron-sulfur subunit
MTDKNGPIIAETEHNPQPGPSCKLPSQGKAVTRRDFLGMGLNVLGAIAMLELGGAGLLYLQSRSQDGKFGSVITAGAVDDFQPGTVTEFADGRLFLIRAADGGFLAVHSRCPHLGCTVMWVPETEQFLCPCHASYFDAYGNFEGPPVPRPLDTFAIAIEDGKVKVDTSHLEQRDTFTPDQLAFA